MKRALHPTTPARPSPSAPVGHARLAGRYRTPRARSAWWPLYHRGSYGWIVHPALTGAFLGLALFAHTLAADTLDVHITQQVQQWTALDGLLQAVSWLGYGPQDLIVYALGVLALVVFGFRYAAAWLVVSVGGSALLNAVIKHLVGRARPSDTVVHVLRHNTDFSFPSGHVMSYLALFGFLIAFTLNEIRWTWLRLLIVVPSALLIVLVGPSRIYLGAHWASDVLGAYLLGAVWLSLVLQFYTGRFFPSADAERKAGTGSPGQQARTSRM